MQRSELICDIDELEVPEEYQRIWNDINLPIQEEKGRTHDLSQDELAKCLSELSRRGYYLVSIAEQFGAKNIAEVGTAQGWQFYTFAHYAAKVDGFVWSCDIRDVRDKDYAQKYSDVTDFVSGTSEQMAETIKFSGEKIDMFYIDGWHERGWVLQDVERLKEFQSDDPIWIFDDYDERFGCSFDIDEICEQIPDHYIYRVGNAASGQPNHQVAVFGRIE
jgi:hypothetical protein